MTGWSLRLARAGDAAATPAIERAAAALFDGQPGLGTFDTQQTWTVSALERLIRKGHCLTAQVSERMAGFLVAEAFGRELHLWEMSVAPPFQQRGIGAGLVHACLVDARNLGFAAVTLTTFRDLPWNEPFYARLGFSETEAYPRLDALQAEEAAAGMASERRCAMIRLLC